MSESVWSSLLYEAEDVNESVNAGTAKSSVEEWLRERAREAYLHASLEARSFISFPGPKRGDGGGARKHIFLSLVGL